MQALACCGREQDGGSIRQGCVGQRVYRVDSVANDIVVEAFSLHETALDFATMDEDAHVGIVGGVVIVQIGL